MKKALTFPPGPYVTVRVTVELHDGRTFDLTGLSADEGVALLQTAGVRLPDIKNTWHVIRSATTAN